MIRRPGYNNDKPLEKEDYEFINKYNNYLINKQNNYDKIGYEEEWNTTKVKSQNANGIVNRTDGLPGYLDQDDYKLYYYDISDVPGELNFERPLKIHKHIGKENTLLSIGNYIYMKFFFSSIINEDKFNNWCKKLAEGYTRRNPYHSDLHAADVAQTCLIYIQYGQLIDITKLNKVSICTIFLSCLCHDFKHPGVNNNFLKETKNELAIRYNDLSILENMHISETFRLINQNNDCNIFLGVDSNIYKDMRKKMISCVLSTDMTFHSKH